MADSAEDKEKAEKLAAAKKRVCSVHVAILLLSCVLPLLRTTAVSFFPFLFVFSHSEYMSLTGIICSGAPPLRISPIMLRSCV